MNIEEIIKMDKLVFDTSIYIEYFKKTESKFKISLRKNVFTDDSTTKIYSNLITRSEIFYILCRLLGMQQANQYLNKIDRLIVFENNKYLYELAGQIKCSHSISLADCYSIATGIIHNCPVLFLEEQEFSQEVVDQINQNFGSQVCIIDKT